MFRNSTQWARVVELETLAAVGFGDDAGDGAQAVGFGGHEEGALLTGVLGGSEGGKVWNCQMCHHRFGLRVDIARVGRY